MIGIFIEFGMINGIIRGLIFIKALIKRAIIKVSFKGNKSVGLNYKLTKKFQNLLHILVLLILTLTKFFKNLLKFLLNIHALNY